MSLLPLALPPGIFRNGTEYQSKGRYFNANLVRWYGSGLGPIGGWIARAVNKVTGMARACLAWKDNAGLSWLGIGTESHLFVSNRLGTLFDITPVGFTTGQANASASGGYSSGTFGSGLFGTPRPDATLVIDATQWSLDRWGQHLVGVSPDDGVIYEWALDTSTPAAAVANSPTCKALVTTAEGFLFALGTTDPRTISWCDQQDDTTWLPAVTNQAGDYPLQTSGRLMCGASVKGGTLILTDEDAWLATYIGGTLIYGFSPLGDGCGPVSRRAIATFDQSAVWMSKSGFWLYDGYVEQVPCDVQDYVFGDVNWLQQSKFYAVHNSLYQEIEFYYCSSSSVEIDRCVVWHYAVSPLLVGQRGGQHWNVGRVSRLTGADRGAFLNPSKVDVGGTIYDHETGFNYDGAMPFAEGGPIEIGNGDTVNDATSLLPDDATVGDVTATFTSKLIGPDDTDTVYGPYTLSANTDVRFPFRQVKVRYDGVTLTAWRVGTPRLEVTDSGSGR